MLNRPALNPRPTDRPARIRGVAWTSVLTIAFASPERAVEQAPYARSGRSRRWLPLARPEHDDHDARQQTSTSRSQRSAGRAATRAIAARARVPTAAGDGAGVGAGWPSPAARSSSRARLRGRHRGSRPRWPSAGRSRSLSPSGRRTIATISPRYMTRDPVRQLEDLVELRRDEQHGRTARRAWR